MKRALSLLLTLAMVMSLFTVSAFADGITGEDTPTAPAGSASNPHAWAAARVAFSEGEADTIVKGGTTELAAEPKAATGENYACSTCGGYYNYKKNALTYSWSVTKTVEGESVSATSDLKPVGSTTSDTLKLEGVNPGTYTVTVTVTSKGDLVTSESETPAAAGAPAPAASCYYQSTASKTVTVAEGDYQLQFVQSETAGASGSAQTLKLTPGATGTLAEASKKVEFAKKGEDGKYVAESSQPTITYKASNDKITFNATTGAIAPVAGQTGANLAKIQATCEFKGKTYTLDVCTVSVTALGIERTVVNGATFDITAKALVEAIAANIKTATGASTAPTLTGVTLSVPTGTWIGKVYYGSSASTSNEKKAASDSATSISVAIPSADVASTTNKLYLTTKKGTIGSLSIPYTATVSGGSYSGTLTLKSGFATAVTDTQTAEFTSEKFALGSVGGSIERVRAYTASLEATSYSSSDTKKVSETFVTPSSSDWTVKYIGYEKDETAHLVTVDFKAIDYDVLTYAQDGSAPFQFSSFESFMESVNKEQDDHSYVKLDSVEFKDVKETGKWELKNGKSTLSTTKELDSGDLAKITVDVSKPGIYTLDFEVNFKYKSTSSGSWSTSTDTYSGILCLYATSDGDIKYEVSYGEAVTFDASDFQKFYKSASSGSSAKLEYVTFDAEPVFGTLYREPSRTSTRYEVDSTDDFYVDPTGTRYDLDKVTYKAALSDKDEYSVYIPFTAYGNRSSESGVVEIVINGDLPFTDVAKTSTFYDYIKYVYNNGIMGGKSATKFDAKSSITRMQLVLTLYRMAGSPTTYNSRVISFTDCKKLSAEATAALKWAIATKVVSGYENNTFSPNSAVTRQAMVTILYRFADQNKYDTSVSSKNNLAGFTDAAKVSASMKTAMNWAVENGFVSGNGKLLSPVGSTTRGAAAKILATFHETYIAG